MLKTIYYDFIMTISHFVQCFSIFFWCKKNTLNKNKEVKTSKMGTKFNMAEHFFFALKIPNHSFTIFQPI
jgi:hypothetical protein